MLSIVQSSIQNWRIINKSQYARYNEKTFLINEMRLQQNFNPIATLQLSLQQIWQNHFRPNWDDTKHMWEAQSTGALVWVSWVPVTHEFWKHETSMPPQK